MLLPIGAFAVATATVTDSDAPGGTAGDTVEPTVAATAAAFAGAKATFWTLPALTPAAVITYASLMFDWFVMMKVLVATVPAVTASAVVSAAACLGMTIADEIAATETAALLEAAP
jgi:hypothetical protein